LSGEPYEQRRYRGIMEPAGLTCYRVVEGESDLYVCTLDDLREEAGRSLASHRALLESYLAGHPSFGTSFRPLPVATGAPDIVVEMAGVAEAYGVGPMATVAGAVADYVGRDLLHLSAEVIVENGGDIFLAGGGRRKVRVFAGKGAAPIDAIIEDEPDGVGLCTSSAYVGPSASLGSADAVSVLADTATHADAAATALGNMVHSRKDIAGALEKARESPGVRGAVIIADSALGAWGGIELA
jgi:ApbE superfamily uncharacterized protein (UPF0280 family)